LFFYILLYIITNYDDFPKGIIMSAERYVSAAEISAYLGVKQSTIYKWVHLKKIPSHKVGRLLKFRISEVDKWIHSGKSKR